MKKRTLTFILTTHYMEEADVSDRVIIIDGGKLSADGSPAELKNKYSHSRLKLYGDLKAITAVLDGAGIKFEEEGGALSVRFDNASDAAAFVAAYPAVCGDFEFIKGSMDDVFLNVTGKKLGGEL